MDDFEIIKLYWLRNEKSIEETELKYGSYLYTISFNILYCKEDAEECVNDTYLNTWNNIPPQKPTSFRVFLGKIVRNLSLDCYKKRYAQKRIANEFSILLSELGDCIPSNFNNEKEFENKEISKQISIFLRKQAKDKQLIFIRRYWYCDSIKLISRQFDFSESKIKSSLFNTRKALREYLEKEDITL